jgi:uncharacterized membrane protein YqjE
MGSVDPNEFWERMKSDRGAGSRGPERGPEIVPAPAPWEQAPQPTRGPGGDARAPSEAGRPNRRDQGEPVDTPVSELVKQLTEQTKALVRQEMRLAQVELKEKGKKVGIGAGMFGAGGLVAFFGAATLITAIVLALSTALAAWLAALIVALVLLAVAGGAALTGKKKIQQATPPVPEQAVETVKEDVEHVKERARK